MTNYVQFDPTTGEITGGRSGPRVDNPIAPQSGQEVLQTDQRVYASRDYVDTDTSEIKQRPTFSAFDKTEIAADGQDAATLSNLPAGTEVTVDDAKSWTVDDGVFAFSTNMPATYTVRVENWPHQVYEAEITAT